MCVMPCGYSTPDMSTPFCVMLYLLVRWSNVTLQCAKVRIHTELLFEFVAAASGLPHFKLL